MKPSNYYFCIDTTIDSDPEYSNFCITSILYWDREAQLDDCLSTIDCLPKGFTNIMESCWEYKGTWKEGKQQLLYKGFIYSDDMNNYING